MGGKNDCGLLLIKLPDIRSLKKKGSDLWAGKLKKGRDWGESSHEATYKRGR